jgi:hypothetical protein
VKAGSTFNYTILTLGFDKEVGACKQAYNAMAETFERFAGYGAWSGTFQQMECVEFNNMTVMKFDAGARVLLRPSLVARSKIWMSAFTAIASRVYLAVHSNTPIDC